MKRRAFIARLGSAAAWPVIVRAQSTMPVIGFLGTISEAQSHGQLTAFRRGLSHRRVLAPAPFFAPLVPEPWHIVSVCSAVVQFRLRGGLALP